MQLFACVRVRARTQKWSRYLDTYTHALSSKVKVSCNGIYPLGKHVRGGEYIPVTWNTRSQGIESFLQCGNRLKCKCVYLAQWHALAFLSPHDPSSTPPPLALQAQINGPRSVHFSSMQSTGLQSKNYETIAMERKEFLWAWVFRIRIRTQSRKDSGGNCWVFFPQEIPCEEIILG